MNQKTFTETVFNGRKAFFRQWTGESSPVANIALVHGMGEHSGRYDHFAAFYTKNNINVYSMDLFGHGQTEGKQGHTASMNDFLLQIDKLLEMSGQDGTPVFLYGHSMGGGLVLNYLFRKHPKIRGVIASAPAIQPGFKVSPLKILAGKLGRVIVPGLTMKNGLALEGISKDPEVIKAYQADPLVHDLISAVVGTGVIEWGTWLTRLHIDDLETPLLIMHGTEDILTSPAASRDFAAKIKTGDITFQPWQGLYHELHNEPEKQMVFDFSLDWIKERL